MNDKVTVSDMKNISRTSVVTHNWKLSFSPKNLGKVMLEYWEAITPKEYVKLKQTPDHQALNYSLNFKSYFKKSQIEATSYFMYNGDIHLINDTDKKVYRCPFNTKYAPGNGSIKNIQLKEDIIFIIQQSRTKEIKKQ